MPVEVNEQKVELPKFAMVNGHLQSGYYGIQENDSIEFLNYYTVRGTAVLSKEIPAVLPVLPANSPACIAALAFRRMIRLNF